MNTRKRLCVAPVPDPLMTMDALGQHHEYESFVLPENVDDVPFLHWTAHLRSFWGWYAGDPDYSASVNDLPKLREVIAAGLGEAGFCDFGAEILNTTTDADLNRVMIGQYTSDAGLYEVVNQQLRHAHIKEALHGFSLAPWILQFNAGIRQQPSPEGCFFRGVQMSEEEIAAYTPALLFEWASFVSASTDREVATAFNGNVLFEITPGGSHSLYGKRNPYDIAAFSLYSEECEVIFPMACTYRVVDVERTSSTRIAIKLETVDFY